MKATARILTLLGAVAGMAAVGAAAPASAAGDGASAGHGQIVCEMTGTTASSLPSFGVSWLGEFDRQEMLTGAAACSEIGLPASYDSIFLDMELQYWPSESRKWTTYHQGRCVMPALLGQGVIEECAASFPNGPEEPQIGRPKRAVFSVGYIQDGDKTVTGTRTMAVIEG